MTLRIGVSACFFHADPKRPVFKGKTLVYLEQSMAHWILSRGALAYMIPPVPPHGPVGLRELADEIDGLVLQGGSDVCPKSYGEEALKPEWNGDYIRDQYEISLVREFVAQKKPVLGICRGEQLLNVAFGGTLYQDITTQVPTARNHRDWEIYDQNFHAIAFEKGSRLEALYPGKKFATVNTVHHQAVKDVAPDFKIEARSEGDGIIEAIRWEGPTYVYGVQWHPEFAFDQGLPPEKHIDGKPILDDFLNEVRKAKR